MTALKRSLVKLTVGKMLGRHQSHRDYRRTVVRVGTGCRELVFSE